MSNTGSSTHSFSKHLERMGKEWVINNISDAICVPYSTRIGFDLVKCNVTIQSIDWTKFGVLLDNSKGIIITAKRPQNHIKYNKSSDKQPYLKLPNMPNDRKYSSIIIEYPHFKLRMLSTNKVTNKESYQLSIFVVPLDSNLGNLNNYSCSELKNRAQDILNYLYNCFGILLSNTELKINYFEINRNFPINGNILISYFHAAFCSLPARFAFLSKDTPWGTLGSITSEGIFAKSSTIQIHVYDKLVNVEGIKDNKCIVDPYDIMRVEFVVTGWKQANSWLKTANLFDVQQKNVDEAYYKYIKKYVIDKFMEQFNRFYKIMIDHFPNTQDKQWTASFYRELQNYSKSYNIDLKFINLKVLKQLLIENKEKSTTIKYNLNRCIKLINEKSDKTICNTDYISIIKELLESESKDYEVAYVLNRSN